ncbi:MAG: ADP-dependent NAD(P)H-hydrate dehydratase / NAD(P)H-hydrate epimerase [Thermoleophilaceae bacterium]|nr:ADP-dependent NAD(P)H-hydrate dehydratase / NAD(P)H-hydrate epimerase [Thermoleophilaceae bacterium]
MALPDWLDPVYEAEEMRAVDAYAIEQRGVPSLDLMERAATGLAAAVAARALAGLPIRVVVGKGNNGGDGLAAARILREDGREVDVLAAADLSELQGDAKVNLDRLPGTPPEPFDPAKLDGSGAIVDAMLGTGFEGKPREPIAGAIAAVNRHDDVPVIACDVPSGVNASTGEVEGEAVRAGATATFHASKVGLHVAPGKWHAGEVTVVDIGIPEGAPEPAAAGLIARRVIDLVPPRPIDGSKFKSGVVVIAGGSRGLTGAPTMVALASQRTGAGYVQVAVPASAEQALELRLLEAMTRGCPDSDEGTHTPAGAETVLSMAERAGAVVLGPGIGKGDDPAGFARRVADGLELPLLIDADGLNALVGAVETLKERSAPTVLTPHEGELGRLLKVESSEVAARRLHHAREAAERSGAIVVLKGDDTIVARPGGPVAISPGATPALATAGTGDVLSGVIGALLAKGVEPFAAAAAGVLAHAYAGKHAAVRYGADHVVAGDVIDAIPAAFRDGDPTR